MGAEAIRELLRDMDLDSLARDLRAQMAGGDLYPEAQEDRQAPQGHRGVPQVRQPARLMILEVVSRHPAGAAPLVPLDGGGSRPPI